MPDFSVLMVIPYFQLFRGRLRSIKESVGTVLYGPNLAENGTAPIQTVCVHICWLQFCEGIRVAV